ncbi:MAG: hypothetical protein V3V01_08300 [Acidimicrobiales bacterium]
MFDQMRADQSEMTSTRLPGEQQMRFGLLAMVAGVILLVPGLIGSWFFLSDLLFSPAHTVPGAIEKTLDSGTYLVSIETSSTNSYGPVSVGKGKGVRVFSLTVFNPAGDEIELRDGSNQSISRNGTNFSGYVVFDAKSSGEYTVVIETSSETTALLTRSLTDLQLSTYGWFVMAGIGGTGFVVGAVFVLAGYFNRKSALARKPEDLASY